MYTRQCKEPPVHIVENGKANFGTFSDITQKLSIKGMKAPFAGIPFPSFITNLRIKSRLNYIFSLDRYAGSAEFFDFKVFSIVEIIFWNKETGKKSVYHTWMAPRYRSVPNTSNKGICACYKKKRFIKIAWGRKHQHHSLSFKIKGDNARSNADGFIYSNTEDDMHTDTLFVNPAPTSSRCIATWFSTMKVNGHIRFKDYTDDSNGLGAMILSRSYYKSSTQSMYSWGIGKQKDKNIIFQLYTSNMDAADSDKYNSNILIIDGKKTNLPPVVMTHPFGTKQKWIIQDTESMVDLTFTPVSQNNRILNIIALRETSLNIYGTFDGVLLNSEGEKIVLKNFPGIINRNTIRL